MCGREDEMEKVMVREKVRKRERERERERKRQCALVVAVMSPVRAMSVIPSQRGMSYVVDDEITRKDEQFMYIISIRHSQKGCVPQVLRFRAEM